MKLHHATYTEEDIKLSNTVINSLGPELHLEKCIVESACEQRALFISGLKMIGGKFAQISPLTNFQFEHVYFSKVKFSGNFIGCDFGDWENPQFPLVEECDFTEAMLDGCRFLNCDVQNISFPKWPCFTLLNPGAARSVALSRQWPSKVGVVLDIYTDNDPECVAVSGNAQRLAEKNALTLDDFRQLLMTLPGIKIND